MKHVFAVIPTLLFLAAPLLAQPQQPPAISEQIVVTASALPEEIGDTPVAATVITRDAIAQRVAHDVLDVLREVPGLAVSRTGSPGKNTTLFIRGGSSKQVLVLWNGVEMNNAFFSGYDFGQLSSAGVERVEVVRGPFSALYGSEAVSGVINVITKPSASRASLELEAGEQRLFNATLSGAGVGERWSAHGAIERRQDEGFADNDDFTASSVAGGVTALPSEHLSLGLLARYSSYDLGNPFAPDGVAFLPSPQRREDGSQLQLAIPLIYQNARSVYELRLSDSRRDDAFADPAGPFGPESSTVDASLRGARATARSTTAIGAITVGGEYERAVVDSTSSFGNGFDSRSRTNRSAFIEDRFSWSRAANTSIEIAAGARYDDFGDFGSETSPRVAAAWVTNGHKFRASYGEGFRAPAIGELYSPFGGNIELRAERSNNKEIGYEHFTATSSLSVTYFDADYENLISFGPTFQFENIAAAQARGVELGGSRRSGPLQLDLSYTWLDTEDAASGQELLRRPRHSGSLAAGYHAERYSAQLVVVHKGQRDDVTDLFPFGTVQNEAHTTADFVLHGRAGAWRPFVKVENLTDESYEEVFGYPSGRRRASIGVRYTIR